MKHESTKEILSNLVDGECTGASFEELVALAAENPDLGRELQEELRFCELIRQALRGDAHCQNRELRSALETGLKPNGNSPNTMLERVAGGEASAFECDQLVKHLWENPGETFAIRRHLADEERINQIFSEAKSEDAFLESLETRMWAETKQDHFVEDFTDRLEQEILAAEEESDNVISIGNNWTATIVKMTGVAAAIALGAFFSAKQIAKQVDSEPAVASISKSSADAQWAIEGLPSRNGQLTSGLYQLDQGVVSLTMESGSEITVQGPAVFEVRDDASTHVHSGVALARVGPKDMGISIQSKGLSISESSGLVGIDARSLNSAEAVVFDGAGGVCLDGSGQCRPVYEQEAVKAEQDGQRLVDVPFNPNAFAKAWELLSGVEKNIGAVRIELPGSKIGPGEGSEKEVQVFVENESFRPEGDLEVDQIEVGEFASLEVNPGQSLQAKGDLRSYLLQLWPGASIKEGSGDEVEASLTFDHPVVGVIFSSDRLSNSDQSVGSSMSHVGEELNTGRGLDSGNDQFLLSEDRRTINLRLKGGTAELDQIRVLVALN